MPPGLLPPDLHDIEWYLWNAFWELSTDRQLGMGSGPIPWSSIERFASRHPAIEPGTFSQIMRAMDGAYLDAKSEEESRSRGK